MNIVPAKLSKSVASLDALVRDYFDRTTASHGVPPIAIDWPAYLRVEEMGKLYLWTATDDDGVQGFVMYVVMLNPHYKDKFFAECDIIAVRPEMRGKGIARALIECAENKFRRMGVDRIYHKMRLVYDDTKPLFEKLGFIECERTYVKVL